MPDASPPVPRAASPRARLRATDLDDLLARLLRVARGHERRVLRFYRHAPAPADLVQQAVADVLDGRRTWPPDVDAFGMLCGVMRSHVSNFAARQRPVGASGAAPQPREGRRLAALADAATAPAPTSADAAVLDAEFRDAVRALVADDDELVRLVECLFEDPTYGAAALADRLGTDVTGIYNARKRLRRRLEPLRS
jgi:hypothetical protein